MTYAPAHPRRRAPWLAFLLVPLIAVAGLLVPQIAHADAGPQLTDEVTSASEANGLAVRVQGTGSDGTPGAYAALTSRGSVDRGVVREIAAANELPCTVSGAGLEWGFKEAFRAYIDGSIANGEWTTDGDVSYATPLFTWAKGTGGAEDDALDVQFSGAVRFTGHGGVLDTTIANPRLVVDGERAVLLLDVHGTTQAGDAVEQAGVEFAALDLDAATRVYDGEVLTLTEVPATLTAAGAEAFGTYPEGEPLDPLTITATVDGGCTTAVDEPSAAPDDDELETEQTADTGWPVWATVLIVLLVAVAVAVVVAVLVRRRRD